MPVITKIKFLGRLVGVISAILGLVGLIVLICACECCTAVKHKRKV